MKEKHFHIYFSIPENFPDVSLLDSVRELDDPRLKLAAEAKPIQPWAALEWAIPGLIVAYIAKPYFEGFLQEMGKDHYEKLKSWLKKILSRSKQIDVRTVAVGKHKIDPANSQSKAISIFIDLKSGQHLKLLFDTELNEADWLNSMDDILSMVIANYESTDGTDILSDKLRPLRGSPYYTVYAYIDRRTGKWKFIDDLSLTRNLDKADE